MSMQTTNPGWRHFGIFVVSLLLLSPIAFDAKWPLVFFRFDGTYLLIVSWMERLWGSGGIDFGNNPLQGIGGFGLFWHARWEPGLWLLSSLSERIAPTVAMTFYALILGATVYRIAIRFHSSSVTAIASAWAALLLSLPYTYPPLGFEFLWGVPVDITYMAISTAIMLMFFDIGSSAPRLDLLRYIAIATLCGYLLIQVPSFAPVILVVIAFIGLITVIAAETTYERLVKLSAAVSILGLAALIFGKFYYGLWSFTKATFFWNEFFPRQTNLADHSYFIAYSSKWPAWLVYGLAYLGALHAIIFGNRIARAFGTGFLIFCTTTFLVILALGDTWRGPRIAYFDIFLFPFYCVFAIRACEFIFRTIATHYFCYNLSAHSFAPVIIFSLLPWLTLIDRHPAPIDRPLVKNHNPFIWPPAETPVTRFLADKIALHPNAQFRGRVVSTAGSKFEETWNDAPFINQHNYDAMNLYFTGNDHRMYGLWYFNIPTLFESNQFSSPFFHLLNSRFLNAPNARDLRSYETQSLYDPEIAALLGARFLITDAIRANEVSEISFELVKGRNIHVYLIPNPNISGYSVTEIRTAVTAQDAIDLISNNSAQLRSLAVLNDNDRLPSLVRADQSKLHVERGGYRIEASSQGASLLVLPVEYSHCLEVNLTSSELIQPRIIRANVALTAVLFQKDVSGTLRLRSGARTSECRLLDWRDAITMKISEAKHWPNR